MRPHSHAWADRSAPSAWGQCDRCNFTFLHKQLAWQYDWRGPKLQNLRILVCPTCMDKAQEQLRSITLPADPVPILNPRPDQYGEEVPSYLGTYSSSGALATYNSSGGLVSEIDVNPTQTSSGYSTPNGDYEVEY